MKCPYCRSNDVVEWVKGFNMEAKKSITYRCYNCGQFFQERDIKGCGKQIFRYGDNYPIFNKGEEKMKFERGNPVRIKIDTGIYYEGEILITGLADNMYKVKYFDGFKYIEDFFKGEQLEIITEVEVPEWIKEGIKQNCKSMAQLAQKSRIQFKDKGVVPKAKKDDLIDLWIDLWGFLRDKKKEIKQ